MESLRSKPDASWLVDLLHAFNRGDLDCILKLQPKWSAVKDLAAATDLLQEKAVLLALMEMFFRRPSNQRTVTFADIVAATKLPLDKVCYSTFPSYVEKTFKLFFEYLTVDVLVELKFDQLSCYAMTEKIGR